MIGRLEDAKVVTTNDPSKDTNGWLKELYKDEKKTLVYKTAVLPGKFKGYHLHTVRAARYFPIAGKMKIILWRPGTKEKEEHILDAKNPQRLFIPKNIATGLMSIGEEEAVLVNFPDPAYDPSLINEQVEYTEEELEQGVIK